MYMHVCMCNCKYDCISITTFCPSFNEMWHKNISVYSAFLSWFSFVWHLWFLSINFHNSTIASEKYFIRKKNRSIRNNNNNNNDNNQIRNPLKLSKKMQLYKRKKKNNKKYNATTNKVHLGEGEREREKLKFIANRKYFQQTEITRKQQTRLKKT